MDGYRSFDHCDSGSQDDSSEFEEGARRVRISESTSPLEEESDYAAITSRTHDVIGLLSDGATVPEEFERSWRLLTEREQQLVIHNTKSLIGVLNKCKPQWSRARVYSIASRRTGSSTELRTMRAQSASRTASPTEDWNERFQSITDRPAATPEDVDARGEKIRRLAVEFSLTATPICKTIIEELALPADMKTIPAVNAGGIAGGMKYRPHGLFIKFAVDHRGLYGATEFSMKAANHERKGVQALLACQVSNLHFPLVTVVDYLGHRLFVETALPVGAHTLIYGSADGGTTVVNTNREMASSLKKAAEILNLAGHYVTPAEGEPEYLHVCADIEGHHGSDGRLYVLDVARLFPPEAPDLSAAQSRVLFQLLRPELVASNSVPLSSDAHTMFGKANAEEHNADVSAATRRLYEDVIPKFALQLELQHAPALMSETSTHSLHTPLSQQQFQRQQQLSEESRSALQGEPLRILLHSKGVNMRHLGHVRSHLRTPQLRALLLADMIARTVSKLVFQAARVHCFSDMRAADALLSAEPSYCDIARVNAELRRLSETASDRQRLGQQRYRVIVVAYLNLVLLTTDSTHSQTDTEVAVLLEQPRFWMALREELKKRFANAFSETELGQDAVKLQSSVDLCQLCSVLQWRLGIQLAADCMVSDHLSSVASQTGDYVCPLRRALCVRDVTEVTVKTKGIRVVSFVDEMQRAGRHDQILRYYWNELGLREKALGYFHPHVASSLENLAELYANDGHSHAARALSERAVAIREENDDLAAMALSHLRCATINRHFGEYKDAMAHAQAALHARLTANAAPDLELANVYDMLGWISCNILEADRAQEFYSLALNVKRALLSENDLGVLRTSVELGRSIVITGHYDRAYEIQTAVLRQAELFVQNRSLLGAVLHNLAVVLMRLHRYEEAKLRAQRAVEVNTATLGLKHVFTAHAGVNIGIAEYFMGRYDEAIACFHHALSMYTLNVGDNSHPYGIMHCNIGKVLLAQGKYDEAATAVTTGLRIIEKKLERSHPDIATALFGLAVVYCGAGRTHQAEPLLRRALDLRRARVGPHVDYGRESTSLAPSLFAHVERFVEHHVQEPVAVLCHMVFIVTDFEKWLWWCPHT